MTTSSPVPIPSKRQKSDAHSQSPSAIALSWGHDNSHLTLPNRRLPLPVSTSSPYPEICSPPLSDHSEAQSVKSPELSPFADCHERHPFSPPPLRRSLSSSTASSLSSPSTASSRFTRAFSPPREPVFSNDPLCICEDPEESCADEEEKPKSERHQPLPALQTSKKPARRKSQFKSSLTASLKALKDHLPNALPQPTIYTPALVSPRARSYSLPQTLAESQPLSISLPEFASSDPPLPPSSAVHLQTYSVSFGPPRKPREARFNSDFLRLLALEMEMRRSGKFGSLLPESNIGGLPNQGIVVSGKVRMILPRRSEKERDDVNMSTFNKSRLKW